MVHDGSVGEKEDAQMSPQMGHDGWVRSAANDDRRFIVVKEC